MRRRRKHVVAAENSKLNIDRPMSLHGDPALMPACPRSKRNHYFPARILQPGVQPVCPYRHEQTRYRRSRVMLSTLAKRASNTICCMWHHSPSHATRPTWRTVASETIARRASRGVCSQSQTRYRTAWAQRPVQHPWCGPRRQKPVQWSAQRSSGLRRQLSPITSRHAHLRR